MKLNTKIMIFILLALGIVFVLSPIISNNLNYDARNNDKSSEYSKDINSVNKILKFSKISGKIHIDGDWSAAKAGGICSGSGTSSDPYILKDFIIDADGPGSCILIENSDVYFKIENCTLFNSGTSYILDGGITLNNVTNGVVINNTCYSNFRGINVRKSYNNIISGNIANNNIEDGIYLWYSNINTVSGNTANNNGDSGIMLHDNSNNNIISGNTANNNYENGIYLWICNNNTISGNTANNNTEAGINLRSSDNNKISENILMGNDKCILEEYSQGNKFKDNKSCNYGEGDEIIPGYNLFFLLGILSFVAILISRKIKKSSNLN